jgi:tRNA U34 5-methylaminomethyl-2-thiouridine-forming methyltransferase MnmC
MKGDKPIELRVTSDGSPTLFCSEIEECYHSVHGARTESEHIFLRHGFDFVDKPLVRVLEVGLGTGLNMLLTLMNAGRTMVVYHAVEKFPVAADVIRHIMPMLTPDEQTLMQKIHDMAWDTDVQLNPYGSMRKIHADMTQVSLSENYDVVYFDAFSPEKQPEMWSEEIFRKCYEALASGGVLVTYCSKGVVKTALRNVGFDVKRYDGPPGKRHIVVAFKR